MKDGNVVHPLIIKMPLLSLTHTAINTLTVPLTQVIHTHMLTFTQR